MTSHSDVPVQTSLCNIRLISLKSDAGTLGVRLQNQGRHMLLSSSSIAPAMYRTFRTPARTTQSTKQFTITKIFSLEKLLIQHGHSTLINFFHPASTISLFCISLAGILSLHIQSTWKNRLPSGRIRLPSRLEKTTRRRFGEPRSLDCTLPRADLTHDSYGKRHIRKCT